MRVLFKHIRFYLSLKIGHDMNTKDQLRKDSIKSHSVQVYCNFGCSIYQSQLHFALLVRIFLVRGTLCFKRKITCQNTWRDVNEYPGVCFLYWERKREEENTFAVTCLELGRGLAIRD